MASRVALAFVVFALNGRCLFAQITAEPASLRGDSPQTRKRLAEAEKRVLSGKADEVATAVEELQRILDEGGDDLISLDGKLHRAARWIAHPILAKLPHDALKSYRDRIEEPARKLLDAGKRDRDIRPLWQLLDRYFVSRPADEGSLLLGDLLFERGDFRTAELVWKRLLPESDADVAYPGSRSEAAAVQARIILAAVFAGEAECAKEAFAEFQKKHSKASGSLGGKTGLYADVLKEFVDRPPPVSASWDRNWPTFGGDPARSGRIPGPLAIRRAPRPTWTEPIPFDFRIPNSSFRHPVGHPVVLNGWVYVADPYHVAAFELKTGLYRSVYSLGRAEFPEPVKKPDPNAKSVEPPPTSPTLTAWNGRLYARLGHPSLKPGVRPEDSAIICFAPLAKPGRESPPLREQWRIYPPVVDGKPGSAWEGAPLIAQGRLWAAFARFEGGRVVHSIACYDPADSDSAPERPAWVAEVADCAVLSNSEVQARGRQELLTLAGRYIVFCTNAGAVVALDAATGHRAWAVQYPRSVRRVVESNRSPDPSPAVVYGGRIFVAPADADRVFAFDAETGNELWESGALEGGQILGVARNRLVVSSTGPVQGIRGLNVATGSYHAPEGWIQASGLLGYGQGLVSDDIILWPSRAGLFFLDPLSGSVIASLKTMGSDPQLFGNLAVADGWLVVVSSTQVWAYYTDEPPYIRPPDLSPRDQFRALVDRAENELQSGRRDAALSLLHKVAAEELPTSYKAWAAARLHSLGSAIDPVPEQRKEWLLTTEGEFVTLGMLIDRKSGRPKPSLSSPGSPILIADRKPLDATSLDAEAAIARTTRLPPGSLPLVPILGSTPPKQAVFLTPRDLVAVSLAGGELHRFAREEFTHVAEMGESFVAAGPHAVAVYNAEREPLWVFRVPVTDPLPGAAVRARVRSIDEPPSPDLSSFSLAGDWLFARLGERHIIAFDLKARCVAWVLGTHGRTHFEPMAFPTSPRFTPRFFVSERFLVAQLSDGRRWTIQSSTGRVWGDKGSTFKDGVPEDFGSKTAAVPWITPPIDIDGGVAYPDSPGRVRLAGHASKSLYEVEGESSLSGEPPQHRRFGDAVFVAVRRNYGVELDRIEPSLARSAWTGGAAFLDAGRIDLAAADADPQRLFVPAGHKLVALSLGDGKPVWEVDLPAGGQWIVHAGRRVVIVHPAEAIPEEPVEHTVRRLRLSFLRDPQPGRLPWLTSALYDSWTDRTIPVLLLDPETGKRLSTFKIPAFGPTVETWFDGDHAVVATSDRICWLK